MHNQMFFYFPSKLKCHTASSANEPHIITIHAYNMTIIIYQCIRTMSYYK